MTERSSPASINKRQSLASLISRTVILGFILLTVAVIGQSYRLSVDYVERERERNITQTTNLLQNVLDTYLQSIQYRQDTYSSSAELQSILQNNPTQQALDDWVLELERKHQGVGSDFAFIAKDGELLWEDGNSPFFGISMDALEQQIQRLGRSGFWYGSNIGSDSQPQRVLLRKNPVISASDGKALGELFIGVLLHYDNALLDILLQRSGSSALLLMDDESLIISNLSDSDPRLTALLEQVSRGDKLQLDGYLISESRLQVNRNGSAQDYNLSVIALTQDSAIQELKQSLLASGLFSLVMLLVLVVVSHLLIQRQVSRSLNQLVEFSQAAATGEPVDFAGSSIKEFDLFGKTLQRTLGEAFEKEQSLLALFYSSQSPIVVWNQLLNIERINPAGQRFFLNNQQADSNYRAFNAHLEKDLLKALEGKALNDLNRPFGGRTFRWNLSPLVIEGKVIQIFGQCQDVTSMIEAEHYSRQAREQAEASAQAKSNFLAKISHEIRTPLNGILGMAQLLKDQTEQDDNKQKVDVIYQSGEHLLAVLNDVLDFSAIEQGKIKLDPEPFELEELVSHLSGMYRPLCQQNHVEFQLTQSFTRYPRILADRAKLNQILFNLIGNAVKFTHQGFVRLSLSLASSGEGENTLHIEVADSGIGISEEALKRIFEPFVQAEDDTTRRYGGSGLGLSIVSNITKAMGGEIQADSREGRGSKFSVAIPVTVLPALDVVEQEAKASASVEMILDVLLVEDNRTNAMVIKALCKKRGCRVDWVEDGLQALERLQSKHYDLILMDNQMPGLSGIDTTSKIRQELKLTTPIFACTADAFEETQQAFLRAGADYVLVKPLRDTTFSKALEFYQTHFASESTESFQAKS
ncbi:LuxQ periplasmic sensor domain-containing protein [Aliagarivorans marinus]|uniref:LuxQ periplasmic sensor domain-containing protein n=1 Tax=Aliagarivorans marinus TaxID=561965 RepID=UPI0004232555|nr:LuxQ periplasmic sensor domain-containing protein [Aliagarivorans marinus]